MAVSSSSSSACFGTEMTCAGRHCSECGTRDSRTGPLPHDTKQEKTATTTDKSERPLLEWERYSEKSGGNGRDSSSRNQEDFNTDNDLFFHVEFAEELDRAADAIDTWFESSRKGGTTTTEKRNARKKIELLRFLKRQQSFAPSAKGSSLPSPAALMKFSCYETCCGAERHEVQPRLSNGQQPPEQQLPSKAEMLKEHRQAHNAVERNRKVRNSVLELHATGGVSISNEEVTIDVFKARYDRLMSAINDQAERSPLSQISAESAIKFCSSQLGKANMNTHQFMDLMRGLASQERIGEEIATADTLAVFNVLDFDETGLLSHAHWVSVIPMFFQGGTKVAKAVFDDLDENSDGGLSVEELAKYTTPIVYMIVPLERKELRPKLKKVLSQAVFKSIDIDGDGHLAAEEFIKWSDHNSLEDYCFRCLEDLLQAEEDPPIQRLPAGNLDVKGNRSSFLDLQMAGTKAQEGEYVDGLYSV